MEPIVEARVMHLVGPVASTSPRVNYRAQVSCKSVRPRTGLPVRGFLQNQWRKNMDTTTLLIIIVVLLLLGGGWYGRGRWY
jgi:hypothetical protein